MFSKILVGVDGSENGTRALKVAADLGHRFEAELHIFHAIPHHYQPPILPLPPFATLTPVPQAPLMNPIELKDFYETAGNAILEDAKNSLEGIEYGSDLKVEYHLELDESPEEFATNFATANEVDLIVVGCTGHHSRLRRALIGTVATKIANEAPCQVLVVR
jgi:nucleotide-binding universal stress UspA family protein